MTLRKKNNILSIVNGSLVDLPSPSSLTYYWNFGSLLGIFLMSQILSGMFLSFHFTGDMNLSFNSVIMMMRDMNYGWLVRIVHANGASIYFFLMYIHIGRGLYYGSYRFIKVWLSGVSILLLSMATAFLGYVLPWGQMSFWAATVITNLFSAIPYMGVMLVEWIWGGFAVGNDTLVRFFAFHFILPFIILVLVMIHLLFLHEVGSSNPLGVDGKDKVVFHPYYSVKDVFGVMFVFMVFMMMCLMSPYMFMDVENFIKSNPLVTPTHIQPEWYFLFVYTILRAIPSKIGGVIALFMSVLILYFLPMFLKHRFRSSLFYCVLLMVYWLIIVNWILLTWIGMCMVEEPYIMLGMNFSFIYFMGFFMIWLVSEIQDNLLLWL